MFNSITTDVELIDEQYQPVSLEGRIKEYLELILADLKAGRWNQWGGAFSVLFEKAGVHDAEAVYWCLAGLTRKHTNSQKQFLIPLNGHIARSIYQLFKPGEKQYPTSDLTTIIIFNDAKVRSVRDVIQVVEHALMRLGI